VLFTESPRETHFEQKLARDAEKKGNRFSSRPLRSSVENDYISCMIPQRPLGKTGVMVSCLGLGGYHLGDVKSKREAIRIVQEAVDHGITFMDNAWEYHDGLSEQIMGEALKGRRANVFLMTKVCTHGRDKKVALRQLEQSLRRLKTDYLDLWHARSNL
jgi:aryl-alcohol dehydrogenase-like predicted oxidoreductase